MDFMESLNIILEQVGEILTDVSSKVAKGSEEFVKITKIKYNIRKIEDEIEYSLIKLGNIYYRQVKEEISEDKEELNCIVNVLDDFYLELEMLKNDLDIMNKNYYDYGYENDIGEGDTIAERDEISPELSSVVPIGESKKYVKCPECGHENSYELAVCTECGAFL